MGYLASSSANELFSNIGPKDPDIRVSIISYIFNENFSTKNQSLLG